MTAECRLRRMYPPSQRIRPRPRPWVTPNSEVHCVGQGYCCGLVVCRRLLQLYREVLIVIVLVEMALLSRASAFVTVRQRDHVTCGQVVM